MKGKSIEWYVNELADCCEPDKILIYKEQLLARLRVVAEAAISVITRAHDHIDGFHYISDTIYDKLVDALTSWENSQDALRGAREKE